MAHKLTITLTQEELRRLEERASQELRLPHQQATWELRQLLTQAGQHVGA
jgi:hypothetical protein